MPLDPRWTQTIDPALTDRRWDEYDALIQKETADHTARLNSTPGFPALDWKVFKAMVWVESGGPSNPAWKARAMQIGNPGDPGYATLRDQKEAAPLVMSDQLKADLKSMNISDPKLNVRAGIAYAMTRLAQSVIKSVDEASAPIQEYTVVPGDSFDKIAKAVGTTIPSLTALNPTARMIFPKQKLKYRKAGMQRVITGWRPFTTSTIAATYNVGDPKYKEKLDYVLALFPKLKR